MATWPLFQPRQEVYQIIRKAIQNKEVVFAIYDGKERHLCPHVLGKNKEGESQALFYQFGGGSRTGLRPDGSGDNWRCLALNKLSAVRSVKGFQWHTAPNHARPQSCVKVIDIEVN